jgi:hypothetical protein
MLGCWTWTPDLFGKELAEQVHADRVHEDFLSGFEAA